ncbi:MAG: HDIG domain-containing protein [Candidatus Poribacteria bacterium]|nr:HDIG domain-containing protein [Candidatus Poribacteria bacterium]MDE0502908.1 HDIG domain-containing protein [Candidatus Poribacteria bacterium]
MKRESALELLREYTRKEGLIKHALAVEACMRSYAQKWGEDEEQWGNVGLLHDFDYEMYPSPDQHPEVGARILEEKGYPPDVIYAIRSHADYLGLERKSLMDKTLYAVDELAGFVTAVALVRPNRNIAEVKVSSVQKKLKDKAFARTVNRVDIKQGAAALDIPLNEHIAFVIDAMKGIADELGLDGD